MSTLIIKGTATVEKKGPIDIEVRFSLGEDGPMLIEFVEKVEVEDNDFVDNYIEPDDVNIPREELGKLYAWLGSSGAVTR
jgi:hypothetical protein